MLQSRLAEESEQVNEFGFLVIFFFFLLYKFLSCSHVCALLSFLNVPIK